MRSEIIIVDDFYPDPMKVRNYALSVKWQGPYDNVSGQLTPPTIPLEDDTWKTSSNDFIRNTVFNSEKMIRVLESITNDEIDRESWFKRPAPWNSQFHVKMLDDFQGGYNQDHQSTGQNGIHNHTHDPYNGTGANGWAAIVFLTPEFELSAGMFSWLPKGSVRDNPWTMLNSSNQFEPMDSLANRFNRLILGRGDLWHSGANGRGRTMEEGRMFQTFFFRTLGPLKEMRRESLDVSDLPEPLAKNLPMAEL